MLTKRLISLILTILCLLTLTVTPFLAAANADKDAPQKPTAKPTEAPTEPPLTAEELGYSAYAAKLDTTVYDGELGAIYSPDETIFRLWSPVADDVKVCIYKTGSDDEKGAQMLSSNPMKYAPKNGGWYLTLEGNYKNCYYTYQVTIDGETNEVVDPYAKAVGVNGERGMIVDLDDTDPEDWDEDSFRRVYRNTEATVWEVSIRDFSSAASSGVSEENRGKYLAFTETDTTLNGEKGEIATCVNYLKQLGVNYVQINPFFDFAGVDEDDPDTEQYNWGYTPKNFNVPEGSYSSDPYDGRVRIKECKQMIQALHEAGIGVIMDVVYNHTYYSRNSNFSKIVPDYYYRIDDNGSWSNGSDCENDLATERYMVSRFIRDSVAYWAEEYHIDGFRFDQMGLIDADTISSVRQSLDAIDSHILMYGDAKKKNTKAADGVQLANQDNMQNLSKRIGAYNNSGCDAVRGSNFDARDGGFVQEGISEDGVRGMIEGAADGWASIPNQVVNYVSTHDNLTLYDKLYFSEYGVGDFGERHEDLVSMNKLAAAIVMMSRGMPLMLAGEEFARTKGGDSNSFNSSIEVNQLDWNRIKDFPSLLDYYKGIIKLRSSLSAITDAEENTEITYLDTDCDECIAYSAVKDRAAIVISAFNGSPSDSATVMLPDGKWVLLADGERAGLSALGVYTGSIEVPHTSAAILVNASGYRAIGEESDEALIYARVIDKKRNTTVYEKKLTGSIGDSYTVTIPDEILFRYNIEGNKSSFSGTFEEDFEVLNISCEKYEGDFSSVTFRYLNDFDEAISNSILMTNRVGQQYYSQPIPQIPGYVLDLDRLPDNGAGLYTEDPIEVVYYFKPADTIIAPNSNPEYSCRANVIYMGSDGAILDTKTYLGVEGDEIEVTQLEFDGYTFKGASDNYAVFSPIEANIIVNYEKKQFQILPFIIIGSVTILVAAALIFFFIGRGKRKKIESILIEE